MKAIRTHYIAWTDTRPSRVCATAEGRKIVQQWDDSLSVDDNHASAAAMLGAQLGWVGTWIGGTLPNGHGVWVMDHAASPRFVI
jgi:hypothetical protein